MHAALAGELVALTASLPMSRCTIFCLKASEYGLVTS
jgi:hypothetical protein